MTPERKAYMVEYRAHNREKARLASVLWRQNNVERSRTSVKRWRAANVERRKELNKRWRVRNRDTFNAIRAVRRARQLKAKGRYTAQDIQTILLKQRNKCLCGVSFLKVKHTVDHKVPLSRGGSNYRCNIQLLCMLCNDQKGARTMREWRRAA